MVNGTMPNINEWNLIKNWPMLPNGYFRLSLHYHDEIDSNMGIILIFIETKYTNGSYEH